MTSQQLTENILEIAKAAVPHMPHKWANIQNIAIKTPESVALPIYNKTPEVLREIAAAAGVSGDVPHIDTPEKEAESESAIKKETPTSEKKREMSSPLLRALKKQKKEEEAKTLKQPKEDTPNEKKLNAEKPSKKIESPKDAKKETPKSN